MSAPPLRLGPFDIHRAVGRGAMGEVSLALHRTQGTEVAIKILHGTTARDPWAVEAFRNEVRAVAALSHPGIVSVVDHGVVEASSDLVTQGHFPEGTPYLVMEFVKGRPMNRFVGRLSWNQIRAVLLQLLDALAHSHARGVVHRDLKPGNVLLTHPGGRLPSVRRLQPNHPLEVKLTDFGLAQALDRHSAADAVVAGTPAYMAPEQLQGRWRDQGPWTDLYAVGCLAWAMATGRPPFGKDQPFEDALHDHLHRAPPPFRPVVPVPPGFEGWLRRLLAKTFEDRFPRAADAAWGLAQLSGERGRVGGGIPAEPTPVLVDEELDDTDYEDYFDVDDQPTEITESPTTRPVLVRHDRDEAPPERAGTPVPLTWRRQGKATEIEPLFGVGLNLFGIRPPPFVGRMAERDLLWQSLRDVYDKGVGQAVILEGSAGVGLSRLGRWLCQRADEVGAARVFTARHGAAEDGTSGLVPMVARYLRCSGLDRTAIRDRLVRAFPHGDVLHDEIDGLTELLSPDDSDGEWARRFRYPRERFALVRRLLEREATGHSTDDWEAVVVLWLDDAHLGSDTLDFCRFVLESQTADPLPILLLISAHTEALADAVHHREAEILAAISDHPRTQTVPLAPLAETDHTRLVQALLGMEGELVEQVAARTAGSPLFAVQLVGDWISRGLLRPGQDGFTLDPTASVELPSDIGRVWGDRVERLVIGLKASEAGALELAAVLGAEVDRAEWETACRLAGLEPSHRLLERLAAQRLVDLEGDPEPTRFAFTHAMLREALIQRAGQARRLEGHHQSSAQMLQDRAESRRGVSERLGRHLLMSGHVVPALGKLLEGARERRASGEAAAARRLLDYRERALKRLDLPHSDALWGLGWVERAELDLESDLTSRTDDLLQRCETAAVEFGWTRVAARAAVARGRMHLLAGRLQQAIDSLDGARTEALRLAEPQLAARAGVELGSVYLRQGEAKRALDAFQAAQDIYRDLDDAHGIASCMWQAGRVGLAQGDVARAVATIPEAHARFEAVGARWSAAECVNGLGDLARLQGDTDTAEARYREALAEMEAIAHASAVYPRLNLGVVLVERGAHVEARRLIEPLLRSAAIRARPALAAGAHLILLSPVAAAGDWAAWDHHVGRAGGLLASTGIIDRDNAHLARLGGEQAVLGGEVDRARSAFGLAWQQLQALHDTEGLAEVEALVRALA